MRFLLFTLGWFALAGCLSPTQVTFDIRTDVPCSEVARVGVVVGPSGTVEDLPLEVTTRDCAAQDDTVNAIGTYAAVPKDGQAQVDVRVAMALKGGTISDCTRRNDYKGCIVARRTVSFLPRRGLVVPIDLFLVCRDIGCDAKSTCNRLGRCTASQVDVGGCVGNVCEATLGASGRDGGEDIAPPVAARSTWVASPDIVPADGVSATTLTLSLRDAFGGGVPGQRPVLTFSGQANSWAVASDVTDDAGVFIATLTSTAAEEKTVTVRTLDVELDTTVTFVVVGGTDAGADGGVDGGTLDGGSLPACPDAGTWAPAGCRCAWSRISSGGLGLSELSCGGTVCSASGVWNAACDLLGRPVYPSTCGEDGGCGCVVGGGWLACGRAYSGGTADAGFFAACSATGVLYFQCTQP